MKRILILGEQSFGLVFGAFLSGSGFDVNFITEDEYTSYVLNRKGLYIFGNGRDGTCQIHTCSDMSALSGIFDILVFNSTDIERVHDIPHIMDHLHPESVILCPQTGILEDIIEDLSGGKTIVSLQSGLVARCHAPGNVEIQKIRTSLAGVWKGRSDQGRECITLLRSVLPVTESLHITAVKYSHLVFDACLGALCSISGVPYGAMMRNRRFRSLIVGVMSEAVQVAEAHGHTISPYRHFFDYYSFLKGDNAIARWNRNIVLFLCSFAFEERISQQLRSILDGKKSDIDALNGYITRAAQGTGIITPLNDLLIAMVKEIENNQRRIGLENFQEEFFYFYG